jgi:integrase
MGSFYVSPLPSGRWRVIQQTEKDGVRDQQTVPKEAYLALGLAADMSIEQAREQIKRINKDKTGDRLAAAKAARNHKFTEVQKSKYLPEELSAEYGAKLRDDNFGSDAHLNRLLSHWQTVQTMIAELEIEPREFEAEAKKIFKYFIEQAFSPDYCKKLLRILNGWGSFVCRKRGQHFEHIKKIPNQIRERIAEANEADTDTRGNKESSPLTAALLADYRKSLSVSQGNWLLVSFAFGLRPLEVDDATFRTEVDENGITIVWIYQSKLVGVPKADRWKPVPILDSIQEEALKAWAAGQLERPELGKGFTVYAGRKGFEQWMKDVYRQPFDAVSTMLGHKNVQRTYNNYRNKKVARYELPKKKESA